MDDLKNGLTIEPIDKWRFLTLGYRKTWYVLK